jgi:acetyl-CoA carboxylase biotin carboxyl carrier protein
MTISIEDINAIVRMFEQGKWRTLELRVGGSELFLGKENDGRASWDGAGASQAAPAAAPRLTPPAAAAPAAASTVASAAPQPVAPQVPEGCVLVSAPTLGMFYRSPKPGAASYVEVGQKVGADTELCLIEVMKLFTTLRAGVAGVIREVLVKDGGMVEYGQPLFLIDTNG